jgi:hypothetical protein
MNYQSLFELIIYHDYFLDKGLDKFNTMDEAERAHQLSKYKLSDFFEIIPSYNTRDNLSNFRFISRMEKDRLKVAVSTVPSNETEPLIHIKENLVLTFLIRSKSPDFQYYTDLDFETNQLLLLSNFVPDTELPAFPLMKTDPLADPDDAYLNDDFFMNNTTRNELASEFTPEELFGGIGIITVKMKIVGDEDLSVIVNKDEIFDPARKFIIQFRNKKYFWKFKQSQDAIVFRSDVELPLVKNGFIALDAETDLVPPQTLVPGMDVPNPSVFSFETMTIGSSEELCSVIYI